MKDVCLPRHHWAFFCAPFCLSFLPTIGGRNICYTFCHPRLPNATYSFTKHCAGIATFLLVDSGAFFSKHGNILPSCQALNLYTALRHACTSLPSSPACCDLLCSVLRAFFYAALRRAFISSRRLAHLPILSSLSKRMAFALCLSGSTCLTAGWALVWRGGLGDALPGRLPQPRTALA